MDVRQDAAAGDGDGAQELVQLLVVADGELDVTFLPGTGRHRAQIAHFFRGQIGSRTPSGIGLLSGSRLRRMRPYLELPRELWIENLLDLWSSPTTG